MQWLYSTNHKDIGTLRLFLITLIGFVGIVITIFILLKFSHSNRSIKGDQLFNVLAIIYTLLTTFFLSTFTFIWGFKNWLLPSILKIKNKANFYSRLIKISPVLRLIKKLQVSQIFVKNSFIGLYYKMFYINQVTLNLFTCMLIVIIQCILLKLGIIDFGFVAHCKGSISRIDLAETCPQASNVNETPPVLPDMVVIQIPSSRMGESVYEISLNSNELNSQITGINEGPLETQSSETEEPIYEAITNLDELNTLVPVIDEVSPNREEDPIYEVIPDLEEPASQDIARDQACCITVTQQKDCSSYIGFFVGLSLVAAFTLYLVYFNGAGEITRSCNFPDLIKQLEDIFRNL